MRLMLSRCKSPPNLKTAPWAVPASLDLNGVELELLDRASILESNSFSSKGGVNADGRLSRPRFEALK